MRVVVKKEKVTETEESGRVEAKANVTVNGRISALRLTVESLLQ